MSRYKEYSLARPKVLPLRQLDFEEARSKPPAFRRRPSVNSAASFTSPLPDQVVTQVRSAYQMADSEKKSELLYREHLFQTFQSLKLIQVLPTLDLSEIRKKAVSLPRRPGFEDKKTLILDLDETLVHCLEDVRNNPDHVIHIDTPSGSVLSAGINVRPYVQECLRAANRLFEVIVFTASQKFYADKVLDILDPSGQLIHHRLYRENCIALNGLFIKDLRLLERRAPKDIVIVDNAVHSFAFQLDNGVPIISWHDDYSDRELFNLIDYLNVLAHAPDVREVNRNNFRLNDFYEDYLNEFVRTD